MWDGKYPAHLNPETPPYEAKLKLKNGALVQKNRFDLEIQAVAGTDRHDQIGVTVHDAAVEGGEAIPE